MRSLAMHWSTPWAGALLPARGDAPVRLATALTWALAIAVAHSTQFLFQPFVWEHWPWDDVLRGWLEVARDRAVVAVAIALAVVAAGTLRPGSPRARAVGLGLAILGGALAGELALLALGWPGDLVDAAAVAGRVAHWSLLGGCVAAMAYLWMRVTQALAQAQREELRRADAERAVVEARLQALRSQIEPHFLFNTLATVRRLHRSETEAGALLLRHFLDYLRLSIAALQATTTTLASELALVKAYLGVLEVRMSGRLRTRSDVPESLLDCEIPPLSIATLVENAVKHGVGPKAEGGSIEVAALRSEGSLAIVVADDGVGFGSTLGHGIGLSNLRSRLGTMYGGGARLALEGGRNGGVRATISIPWRIASAADSEAAERS